MPPASDINRGSDEEKLLITNSIQRKFEGAAGTANASLGNERVAASQAFSVQVGSVQRRNDRSDPPIENFAISLQKEAEYIRTEATMDKERSKMHGSRDTVPSRNHAISRSTEMVSDLVIRKTEGGSTADMEKEKCGERSLVSNSVVPGPDRKKVLGARTLASTSLATAQRRKDVLCMPVENLSSIHGKTEIHIHQKVEKKNKTQVKKAEEKDKITKEKKKEENILENAEAIVANKFRNYGKKDQVDTLNCKPLAPHKDNAIGTECVDGTMKKRKNLDTNGCIKENYERPGKIPRLWELHLRAPSSISLRPDRLLENKERLINGNAISKYLSQIYTVPKMVELPELDDQEWLFNLHDSLQKSKTELKAEKIPQVFAEAMRIDSADILALPYVVPF